MTYALLALRILHILSAALWIGGALFWPGALRRALSAPAPATGEGSAVGSALRLAASGVRVDLIAGLATVVTGLVYAGLLGSVRPGIWVGFGLAILRLGMLFAMARPSVRKVETALAAGDAAAAVEASRKLPAYAGAAHLLWLLALISMVVPT